MTICEDKYPLQKGVRDYYDNRRVETYYRPAQRGEEVGNYRRNRRHVRSFNRIWTAILLRCLLEFIAGYFFR
jgi:hypothetical protein